ncbi:MAG: DUF945 family protein [Pseudomonadota bacterium]
MKKFAIVFVLLILFAGIGMPYVNGLMMNKAVTHAMANINQMNADSGSDIKLEMIAYNRGFYSSVVEWKIDFGSLSNVYGVDDLVFVETAIHGYKGVVSQTSLEKNQWFSNLLAQSLGGENPLHIQTVYPLKGDIVSTLVMDAVSFEKEGVRIELKPARFSLSMDRELTGFRSDLNWKGCEVPGKLKLDQIVVTSEMKKISTYIWDGQALFNVGDFWLQDGQNQMKAKHIKVRNFQDYHEDTNRLSMGIELGVDLFSENGTDELKDGFVRIRINQMDAHGYEQIAKLYTALVHDMIKTMGERGFDPDNMEALFERKMAGSGLQVLAEAEKLLKKDFEIQISDLKARLPLGKIEGSLSVSLKKDMTMTGFLPVMMQHSMVLDIFSLQSKLILPATMVGENSSLLNPIYPGMQTGLFVKQGDMMTHEAQTRDGKLFINTKQVALQLR